MAELAKAYVQIIPSLDGVTGSLESAFGGSAVDKAASNAGGKVGGKFSGAFSVAMGNMMTKAVESVGSFAKDSISAGVGFDAAMSQVAATMGTTVDQITNLRDFAQEMGRTTAFSASEAAEALNYMALAGYDADTSMKMLPTVLNLAAAGGIDLASASDMVTDAQSALGLSLEQTSVMVDQMAKGSSKTNTSVSQLGEAFLTIGGTAKNLSGGTAELTQMLGILADNGIKGAEAGTHLRNIMLALNPTTDAQAAAWEDLGVSAYDADGSLRPLSAVFGDLTNAMSDMTDQEKSATLTRMFNKTDLSSINALLATTSERFGEVSTAIDQASGASAAMAETQLDNLAGDATLFKSALEGAQIAVSDALTPALRGLVAFGSDAIGRLTEGFQKGGLDGAMAELGDIIGDGIGKILSKLPQLVSAGATLIGALAKGLISNLPKIISAITQTLQTLLQQITQNLPQIVQSGGQLLTSICEGIIESLPALRAAGMDLLNTLITQIVENLPSFVEKGFELVSSMIDGIMNDLPNIIDTIVNVCVNLIQAIANNLPLFLEKGMALILKMIDGIMNNLPNIIDAMIKVIQALLQAIVQNLPKILESGVSIVVKLIAGLIQAIPQLVAAIPQLIAGIWDTFMSTDWLGLGADIIAGIGKGIAGAAGGLIKGACNVVSDFVGGVADFFGIGSPSKLMRDEIGRWIPAGMAEGIEDEQNLVSDAMDALGDTAMSDISYQVSAMPSITGKELAFAGMSNQVVIPVYIGDEQLDTLVVDAARRNAYRGGGR